jgi:hypothetical protein
VEISGNRDNRLESRVHQDAAMVTACWVRDVFVSGRRRFKLYAMHVPVRQSTLRPTVQIAATANGIQGAVQQLIGAPTVIGEATLEVPNLEVAKLLHAAPGEMLSKQPPEFQVVSD